MPLTIDFAFAKWKQDETGRTLERLRHGDGHRLISYYNNEQVIKKLEFELVWWERISGILCSGHDWTVPNEDRPFEKVCNVCGFHEDLTNRLDQAYRELVRGCHNCQYGEHELGDTSIEPSNTSRCAYPNALNEKDEQAHPFTWYRENRGENCPYWQGQA